MVEDHLSILTNDSSINTTPINDSFPDEFLFSVDLIPWYANIVNFLATGKMPPDWSSQDKKKFLRLRNSIRMIHTYSSIVLIRFFGDAYQTMR